MEQPRKKMKVDSSQDIASQSFEKQKVLLCDQRLQEMTAVKCSYIDHLSELFFLQNNGNLMDYMSWKKRPNPQLANFLKTSQLDSDDDEDEDEDIVVKSETQINNEVKITTTSGGSTPVSTPVAISTTLPPAVSAIHGTGSGIMTERLKKVGGRHGMVFGTTARTAGHINSGVNDVHDFRLNSNAQLSTHANATGLNKSTLSISGTPTSSGQKLSISTPASENSPSLSLFPPGPLSPRQGTRQHAISSFVDSNLGTQEAIVERAKQEAQVMQRVAALRKEGLWTSKRLPKVHEPVRLKAHQDYLLEEMQWLAADFAQERKWKKAGARKIARMVYRYHQELHQKELKAEKEESLKLRRIAGNMAKIVKEFWSNIEKVVQYKQTSRLEEKRKKALDLHLNFIVDQTEKYSSWLTEGLKTNTSSKASSSSLAGRDDDFEPSASDASDDEETIDKEERQAKGSKDGESEKDEIDELKRQSEMPMDELLKSLPSDYLDKPDEVLPPGKGQAADSDFSMDDDSASDLEETLDEQESHEKNVDHAKEIDTLKAESEMSIEELRKLYGGPSTAPLKRPAESDDDSSSGSSPSSSDSSEESDEDDVGMEALVSGDQETLKPAGADALSSEKQPAEGPEGINDIAAQAMSLQPTGYTLETTQVKIQAPFLLKHTLREYQLIGLNWMATMHDRKLNGILADEMGLGKTIQTISLLAHLAVTMGVWGPHLIVVPTSVMLNWEMELKKWCPAFKILTYYGTQKERKQKRTGWTKTNAFHVCITSYKLVIQDHQAFRRKKWKYFILDEAQNIKNFRSQRWQTLLNFSSQRRLLLTGTPLQNSLMELWSLMHFLMPHVFQSHREFKEWFANPLTGMIEGSSEYNESIIMRLHKVLRPFLLRRLKNDVEKQMPQKYEHVVMCHLSKRQRFLYDDFMSRTKTKETLETGHFMSVINILMQLRKVCNHPNLFDPRPVVSPFQMEGITYKTASLVLNALNKDPLEIAACLSSEYSLVNRELLMPNSASQRSAQLQCKNKLIVEIDSDHSSDLIGTANRLKPVKNWKRDLISKSLANDASIQAGGSFTPIRQLGAAQRSVVRNSKNTLQFSIPSQCSASSSQNAEIRVTHNPSSQLCCIPETFTRSVMASYDQSSPLFMTSLAKKRAQRKADKLERLCRINSANCDRHPVYGSDLCSAVNIVEAIPQGYEGSTLGVPRRQYGSRTRHTSDPACHTQGYVNCHRAQNSRLSPNHPAMLWTQTDTLREVVKNPEQHHADLKDILDRYTFVTPPVMAPRLCLHASHPHPSTMNADRTRESVLTMELSPRAAGLHKISTNMTVQFPELRLIQYDCGKLQTLDILLRRLKSGQHRVLIFTQMTKMLNVLEGFLNFHGHRYLRLDGTTKVEQRQSMMERFNQDRRIFVFILSTRSGGIGVNLTGADTVIFYDSDWNPTMDAQAQDRCHRIGQTRDVHIYRLISEKTIEENILKKANQKRLLGDVAIEGGNFTTAFFKQQTIKDLFEEPSGLEAFAKEHANDKKKDDLLSSDVRMTEKTKSPEKSRRDTKKEASKKETARAKKESVKFEESAKKVEKDVRKTDKDANLTQDQMEQALANAEDETDVMSVKVVKAEQKAELAEFDENIPWDEREAELRKRAEVSKVEMELAKLDKELTPVERYAVSLVELITSEETLEELEAAEEEVTIAKEEWQLSRMKELKEEEEMRAELEEDDMLFTYTQDDTPNNQAFICESTGEEMLTWAPPTPPQDDNDVFIDHSLGFMYEQTIMTESQLPSIYIKKEVRKIHIPQRKQRVRREEQTRAPRSLFDRTNTLQRRDAKLVKMRPVIGKPMKAGVSTNVDMMSDHPEWLIHEDWALLQSVQIVQELPLSLATNSTGHLPNWDIVSEVVTATSRIYRSPKQCKIRYDNVLVPREEGRILYDVNPRKPKKNKATVYKQTTCQTKNNRPMRTSQLYTQDNNAGISTMYTMRFDSTKNLASKRQPTVRHTANISQKFNKHGSVLTDCRINYDSPLAPTKVAEIRAERIARDKSQADLQRTQKQQSVASVSATITTVNSQAPIIVQAQTATGTTTQAVIPGTVLQKVTPGQTAVSVTTAMSLAQSGRSIVVNTAGAGMTQSYQTINKRVGQAVASAAASNAQLLGTPITTVSAIGAVTARQLPGVVLQDGSTVPQNTRVVTTTQTLKQQGGTIQRATITNQQLTLLKQDAQRKQHALQLRAAHQTQPRITAEQLRQQQQQQQIRQYPVGTTTRAVVGQQAATITAIQQSVVTTATTQATQKAVSVTTPLIPAARLQGPKTLAGTKQVTRTTMMDTKEVAALIQRQQQMQQRQLQSNKLTTQIIGAQLQQVGTQSVVAGQSSTGQPVATLVKTIQPIQNIPVSAVSLTSLGIQNQRAMTSKQINAHALQQLRMAQIQRAKTQKITGGVQVQQMKGSAITGPVILQQQATQQRLPVTVQQIQQIVRQQQQNTIGQNTGQGVGPNVTVAVSAPTIQQIINATTNSATTVMLPTALTSQMGLRVSAATGTITSSTGAGTMRATPVSVTPASINTIMKQPSGVVSVSGLTPGGAAQIGIPPSVAGTPSQSPAKQIPVQAVSVSTQPAGGSVQGGLQGPVAVSMTTVAQQLKAGPQHNIVRQVLPTGTQQAQLLPGQTVTNLSQVLSTGQTGLLSQQMAQSGITVKQLHPTVAANVRNPAGAVSAATVSAVQPSVAMQPSVAVQQAVQSSVAAQQAVQQSVAIQQAAQPSVGVQQALQAVQAQAQQQAQQRPIMTTGVLAGTVSSATSLVTSGDHIRAQVPSVQQISSVGTDQTARTVTVSAATVASLQGVQGVGGSTLPGALQQSSTSAGATVQLQAPVGTQQTITGQAATVPVSAAKTQTYGMRVRKT